GGLGDCQSSGLLQELSSAEHVVLSDSVRLFFWRNAIRVVDLRAMRRGDRPIEQRIAGSAHPVVEAGSHLRENSFRARVGGEIIAFVGIEKQVVEAFLRK